MTQDRISIVTACMNREENLLKVLPSWLDSHASEIVLVDWSCTTPLDQTLKSTGIDDERIVIYRVEEEDRWILTHAYNVGLKRAANANILKLDNDHSITEDFFEKNSLSGLDTRLGSWRLAKSEDQAYINGAFLIRTEALAAVGYFNEVITTYGWDDSYLHESLFANGAKIGHLCPDTIRHIEQAEESRTKFQKITKEGLLAASVGVKPTEFMNRRNMYLSSLLPRQTQNTRQASYTLLDKSNPRLQILKRQTSPHSDIPITYLEQADRLAFRDFYCWKNGMLVESTCIHELEDEFIRSGLDSDKTIDTERPRDRLIAKLDLHKGAHDLTPSLSSREVLNLLKYIPFMLSAYGHTDNTRRYQMILNLGKRQIDVINDSLPDWCRDKVIATRPDDADPERHTIDTDRAASINLVGRLVFGSKEANHYFWAAYNCLKPAYKRCLYDFIESAGKPHRVLSNYYLNLSPGSHLRRDFSASHFLRALAAIYPARSDQPFSAFGEAFIHQLNRSLGEDAALSTDELIDISDASNRYTLTLVTSLFKGLRYVVDYALNLRQMHLFARTEILIYVVPSSEAVAIYGYLSRYFKQDSNVKVRLLKNDPGLYECWNLGIRNARGKYVSNANADDRRGRYHSDYLIFLSELHQLSAASSALLTDTQITYKRYCETQDVWFSGMGRLIKPEDLYIDECGTVTSQNLLHCMPIWRRDLHKRNGEFNEDEYGTSCDWEFWLRSTSNGEKAAIVDLPLGFYLQDSSSHNRRNSNREQGELKIVKKYISEEARIGLMS